MFQFATFAFNTYVFSVKWPYGRVSPFGNLRIKVCLLTPRSLSQATTSFIAWYRQGIHHVHLFACLYNLNLCADRDGYKVLLSIACRIPDYSYCYENSFIHFMIDTITTHQYFPTRHHNASVHTDKFFTTSSRLLKNMNSQLIETIKPKFHAMSQHST